MPEVQLDGPIRAEALPRPDQLIGTAGAASMGPADSKVVMIEFSDFHCPFCARYSNDTFWEIVREYVKTGKIQYVFRNFPLRDLHPHAQEAAEAAECAGLQGKYWEEHARLFRIQRSWNSERYDLDASVLGLDAGKFRDCLQAGRSAARVNLDLSDGLAVGIQMTPTFFFGYRDEKDPSKVRALKILEGAQPGNSYSQILEYLLDPPPAYGGDK